MDQRKIRKAVRESMTGAGFVFNRKIRRWVGSMDAGKTISLDENLVAALEIWELDQLIAAAKDGSTSVELGGRTLKFG